MKKILAFLLLTVMLFSVVACDKTEDVAPQPVSTEPVSTEPISTEPVGTEPVDTTPDSTQSNTTSSAQVIDLTMDNFKTFVDCTFDANKKSCKISGVLTFAYYDNVIVIMEASYTDLDTAYNETRTSQFSVALNAAGCAEISVSDPAIFAAIGCDQYEDFTLKLVGVKNVSGTVTFRI